jgi:hypothetical protein
MTAHFNKEKRSPDESIIDADLETGYANYHRSLGNDNSFFLGNSTWTIYNSTSGSTGTITFKETTYIITIMAGVIQYHIQHTLGFFMV